MQSRLQAVGDNTDSAFLKNRARGILESSALPLSYTLPHKLLVTTPTAALAHLLPSKRPLLVLSPTTSAKKYLHVSNISFNFE